MAKKNPYVIIRTFSAGCFAGNLQSQKGKEVVLLNARRLWYWKGAASLSELAIRGTKLPNECKFPVAVPAIKLTEAIETITTTKEAEASIRAVPEWKA